MRSSPLNVLEDKRVLLLRHNARRNREFFRHVDDAEFLRAPNAQILREWAKRDHHDS